MGRTPVGALSVLFLISSAACGDDGMTTDTGITDTGAADTTPVDTAAGDTPPDVPICTPPDAGGTGLSFARDVYPIISVRCAPCHTLSLSGGLAMLDAASAWCNLVGQASVGNPGATRVVAGDSAGSYLIDKISNDMPAVGLRMPRSGPPYLEDSQIMTFRTWIDDGADP